MELVKYMDVAGSLYSTRDLFGWVVPLWRISNDVIFTNTQNVMIPIQPPAPWYDIVKLQNRKSVVKVVRRKYRIAGDLRRVLWATNIFCLNRLVRLAVQKRKRAKTEWSSISHYFFSSIFRTHYKYV